MLLINGNKNGCKVFVITWNFRNWIFNSKSNELFKFGYQLAVHWRWIDDIFPIWRFHNVKCWNARWCCYEISVVSRWKRGWRREKKIWKRMFHLRSPWPLPVWIIQVLSSPWDIRFSFIIEKKVDNLSLASLRVLPHTTWMFSQLFWRLLHTGWNRFFYQSNRALSNM